MASQIRTCKTCKHWGRMLNQVGRGQCRLNPPTAFLVGADEAGNFAFASSYPPANAEQPACSHHAIEVETE